MRRYNAMDDHERARFDEEHTRKHKGQDYNCPPVLPYHDHCMDVLHLFLNVFKVAFSSVFHKPLQMKRKNEEVRAIMDKIKAAANERMKQDFARKDVGGDGVWSCTGPQLKTILRGGHNGSLLADLVQIFDPYFELLEADGVDRLEDDEAESTVAESSSAAPSTSAAPKRKGGPGRPSKKKKKKPATKKKEHEITLPSDDEVAASGDEAAAADDAAPSPGSSPKPPAQTSDISYKLKVVTCFLSISALTSTYTKSTSRTRRRSLVPPRGTSTPTFS